MMLEILSEAMKATAAVFAVTCTLDLILHRIL